MKYYRIRDWNKHFENNRTRELKRMDWLPVPNRHDGSGFTLLLDHPNGMAHYGAWHLILQVASKCEPRGTLLREGAGGVFFGITPQDLARMSHGSAGIFEEVLPRLVDIGWVEVCENPAGSCDPKPAGRCGEVPMEWNGTEGNGTTPQKPHGDAIKLKEEIGKEYGRVNGAAWTYDEESLLVGVASRPGSMDEWAKVREFRRSVPTHRTQFEGVSSVRQLLQHWAEIMDKVATGHNPAADQKPKRAGRDFVE